MKKIYDCFTFFNELDILEIRMNIMNDYVDYFVIVESNKTFTYLDKAFIFEDNKSRFDSFLHKIIYIKVEDMPPPPADEWAREAFQRNAIMRGLKEAQPHDLVLVSDVDEIPDVTLLKQAIQSKNSLSTIHCFMPTIYTYCLNIRMNPLKHLNMGPRLIALKNLNSPENLRNLKAVPSKTLGDGILNNFFVAYKTFKTFFKYLKIINHPHAGFHFTYMGGTKKIMEKLKSFAHQEDAMKEFKANMKDLDDNNSLHTFLTNNKNLVKVDDRELPDYIRFNKEKYNHLFYTV